MSALPTQPAVLFALLAVLTGLAWWFLLPVDGTPPVPSGGAVMAWGIFVVGAFGQLHLPKTVGRLVALELLVVWGILAFSYARSGFGGGLDDALAEPMSALGVGTWVAGSAVLGRALLQVLPEWRLAGLALWVFAVALWLWYLRLLPAAFRSAWDPSGGYEANGAVLLSTVSTQSLVVAGAALLPGGLPPLVPTVLVLLGLIFYAAGLALILRRYLSRSDWTLADDWGNTNCMLHGAMSITGLAIVVSDALPLGWTVAAWAWATVAFVAVEAAEVARVVARMRTYGWREGLFVYAPTQWSRNFTYGMFYTFTLQLQKSSAPDLWAKGVQGVVLGYGQYVVLALLLVETAVFFLNRLGRSKPEAGTGAPVGQ